MEQAELYNMSQEDYMKKYFNKVSTLTAKCVSNESWADGIKDELEEGKEYKVSYISVLRSSTQIMLEEFGDKEFNSVHFEIRENGKPVDYTKDSRFLAPYLRQWQKARMKKCDIHEHLREIEAQYHVKVLFAVESGSRAWGFASKDSDWDVRFVYVHEPSWYFHIEEQKDTIEHMFPDETDLSGWELKKALRLFKRSNPSFFEWLHSPIVYEKDHVFVDGIKQMESQYFDAERAMFHYNHIYKKHNDRYIKDYGLPLKRFLYYLRGILVCKWLADNGTVPPVRFTELVDATVEDKMIKEKIAYLLELKKQSNKHNLEPVDEELFNWAQEWAEFYDQKVESLHPEKKVSLDSRLNKLMFDTVIRKAKEEQDSTQINLFQ